jgi:hypothetical protein
MTPTRITGSSTIFSLDGWPSQDGKVDHHDVVLITEQGRAVKVRKFYDSHAGDSIKFVRPFIIVSLNRSESLARLHTVKSTPNWRRASKFR